jgi:hypothetical protein
LPLSAIDRSIYFGDRKCETCDATGRIDAPEPAVLTVGRYGIDAAGRLFRGDRYVRADGPSSLLKGHSSVLLDGSRATYYTGLGNVTLVRHVEADGREWWWPDVPRLAKPSDIDEVRRERAAGVFDGRQVQHD